MLRPRLPRANLTAGSSGPGSGSTGDMAATLVSFDGTEHCWTRLVVPTRRRMLEHLLEEPGPVAIRGSGLSYPNAATIDGGTTVSTSAFDRFLEFDPVQGTVRVEAGVTVGALLRFVVERGYWFPVLPGHPQISVGGLVACNAHGKTQHDIGNMFDHVVGLTLVHPDHGLIECDSMNAVDVLDLTVGGLGLTGWIADVTLRLTPLAGHAICQRVHRVRDYEEAVSVMRSLDRPGTSIYSWNDANRSGRGFGRGVVFEETFTTAGNDAIGDPSRYRSLTADRRGVLVPVPVWGRFTTSVANRAYRLLNSLQAERTFPTLDAAFPMNGREGYFHLFGRLGFREYQLILPADGFTEATGRVRAAIERTGACVTLSSLKLFAGDTHLLWFRGDGVCLTVDGPATPATEQLFSELDRLAVDYLAPVNLAKDSRLSRDTVAAVFPEYEVFRERLRNFDPDRRFRTDLSRRIDV